MEKSPLRQWDGTQRGACNDLSPGFRKYSSSEVMQQAIKPQATPLRSFATLGGYQEGNVSIFEAEAL
jgi:hypothetical protein